MKGALIMAAESKEEMKRKLKERIENEAQGAAGVYNYMLCCKDCVYRLNDAIIRRNTGKCEEYPTGKPNAVLLGYECLDYLKE